MHARATCWKTENGFFRCDTWLQIFQTDSRICEAEVTLTPLINKICKPWEYNDQARQSLYWNSLLEWTGLENMLSMLQISVSAIFMLTDWKPAQKGGPLGRGWGWGYIRPSLNFKPVVSHIKEETLLLSVFYYYICTCLCCCHSFYPSLCHFLPFFLPCVAASSPCCLSEF